MHLFLMFYLQAISSYKDHCDFSNTQSYLKIMLEHIRTQNLGSLLMKLSQILIYGRQIVIRFVDI